MEFAIPGQANIITLPLVAKTDGDAITSGTVNFYLKDRDGSNAGKWYDSGGTWEDIESVAGTGTHDVKGHWFLSFPSVVWVQGIRYYCYAEESGSLSIPVGTDILADATTGSQAISVTTITEDTLDVDGTALGNVRDGNGSVIAGARVIICADADTDLSDVLYEGTTDGDGGYSIQVANGATYRIIPVYTNNTFTVKRFTV